MNFSLQKKGFLSKPDKSGIGSIDHAIRHLIDRINKNPHYYTTSSCAGRIILMKEIGKKQEDVFIFVSHDKAYFRNIKESLKKLPKEIIYLKHEPCILHVASDSAENAVKIVNVARGCGWKKSGIISMKKGKMMVEMVSTEILATPVSINGKIIVSDDYLKILLSECNKKLKQTRQKIRNLELKFSN